MNLAELRWPDLVDRFAHDPLAIVPVGSVEQHGPHAPLGTDYIIAEEIAREAAARTNSVSCPVVSISVSSHHRHFPGTPYVPARVFEDYLLHYSLSLSFHGVKKLVFDNGHCGNTASIGWVSTTLKESHKVLAISFQWWTDTPKMAEIFPGGKVVHADGIETSMIMSFRSDLVRRELLPLTGVPKEWGRELRGIKIPSDTMDFSRETGVAGVTSSFSPEKGQGPREACIERLEVLIEDFWNLCQAE